MVEGLGKFVCPRCGADSDIVQVWNVRRFRPVLGVFAGKVVMSDDSEETDAPDDRERFYCNGCKHEWPTEGVALMEAYEVERARKVGALLATLQQTHRLLMLKPADLKRYDWQVVHDGDPRYFIGTVPAAHAGWVGCSWSDVFGTKTTQALPGDKFIVVFRK